MGILLWRRGVCLEDSLGSKCELMKGGNFKEVLFQGCLEVIGKKPWHLVLEKEGSLDDAKVLGVEVSLTLEGCR